MKANQISKFIKECEFEDATIHYKNNSQLFSISGVSDVGSSSQIVYLDAGHEDEDNVKCIKGEDLVSMLSEHEEYSVKISLMSGYYPNMENNIFDIDKLRVDFLEDGTRQIHLLS